MSSRLLDVLRISLMRAARLGCALVLLSASSARADDSTIGALRQQLAADSLDERIDAARQLGDWGPMARDAVPELVAALTGDDLLLRYEAAYTLGSIGPDAAGSVPALLALLSDEADLLRYVALNALRRMRSPTADTRQAMAQMLEHDSLPANRVGAARALAELSADAESASPDAQVLATLVEGLQSSEPYLAAESAYGLAALGSESTSELIRLLKSGSPAVQIHAAQTLELLGLSAEAAGPALLARLADSEGGLQRHVIRALPAVGAPGSASRLGPPEAD